jgi:glutathione S-transferase
MSNMMLYTHPHSRGVSVSWMLAECDQAHDITPLQFHTDMKSAEYLALNPAGKVPTLVHNGVVVTETAAILAYLADLHPEKNLAPALDNPLRGEYYKWLFVISNQFEPAAADVMNNIVVTDEMRFALGYPELSVIEQQVTHVLSCQPYLLGEDFSVADMLLAALLNWCGHYKKIITLNETLQAYLQKIISRPAFMEAMKINEALFAKMNA